MTNIELSITEELLLCNFEDQLNVSDVSLYIQELWNGNWETLIINNCLKEILMNYNDKKYIKTLFEKMPQNKQEEIFCLGIASLFCFIQSNFTGPELSNSVIDWIEKQKNTKQYLSIDNHEVDVNVENSELLIITKCIFENCPLSNKNISSWWYLRYVIVHQHILDECSEGLFSEVREKLNDLSNWNINYHLRAKLYLEISQLHLLFGQINESENNLTIAKELLQINFNLSGELGKRTKFQQTNIAQIVLRISLTEDTNRQTYMSSEIPEIIKLDDEVRLDRIQYHSEYESPALPITEQSTILTAVQLMQRARPKDEFLVEESEAYLTALLQQNNNWTIRFNTLLLRCILESKHKRTIERSLSQCESLIDNLNNKFPLNIHRLSTVWSTGTQPRWKIEAHMANLTLNLGLVKASLDLYLKLQMWEEVIVCYTIMQLRHKAAEIIESQLKVNPTVKLWCLLGDATDDISCFEKAWELSQEKSSRAQRHWGQFLFARKNYVECIPHLQKSLDINSLQNMVWLRLGFAALETENWELAATAYRRYTYLEPGGFEAWNNLAKAYIKLGEKTRAHFALQEALKFSFDNWKIWDNFMLVSVATGHYSDVIRSYHQILDLKDKHLDVEVLLLLTKQMINVNIDKKESEFVRENFQLLTKTRELFGRLTSLYPNESVLWEMYADLSPTVELKAQRLYRAYRGLVQDEWSKNSDKCGKVLEICKRLGEAAVEATNASTISSARLSLRSAITASKKQSWDQYTDNIIQLENLLQKITN